MGAYLIYVPPPPPPSPSLLVEQLTRRIGAAEICLSATLSQ